MPNDEKPKLTLEDIKDWKKLEGSSSITAIQYDENKKILKIRFKGDREYQYENVDPKTVQNLLDAESYGKYFYKNIRSDPDKYPYKKIASKLSRESYVGRMLAKQMMAEEWENKNNTNG